MKARESSKDMLLRVAPPLTRVASPPPKPLPPFMTIMVERETRAVGAMKADVSATRRAMRRKRNMLISRASAVVGDRELAAGWVKMLMQNCAPVK